MMSHVTIYTKKLPQNIGALPVMGAASTTLRKCLRKDYTCKKLIQ
jgi:hypothetical protein